MRTGGASKGKFDFPLGALEKPSFATEEQWALLQRKDSPVDASAAAVVDVVKACAGEIAKEQALPRAEQGVPQVRVERAKTNLDVPDRNDDENSSTRSLS
mmetsp:Transcript_62663/g.158630  ORF Transcript_62663/g.158630 Transcript_62663/m.158630 type:complete len:100 (+) Transcript_62663:2-301(+)